MSSGKKEDTPSSDDEDEKIMLKKLSKRVSASSSDNDSEESYEEEYGDSDEDDSFIDREKRQIYEYDDEDVSFDYDEGTTSSIDAFELLIFGVEFCCKTDFSKKPFEGVEILVSDLLLLIPRELVTLT